MTPTAFTAALEAEFGQSGVPFARGDLLAFVAAVWSLIEDDPDPARWAREFIEAARPGPSVNGE